MARQANFFSDLMIRVGLQNDTEMGAASVKRSVTALEHVIGQSGKRMRNAYLAAFPALLTMGLARQIGGAIASTLAPAARVQDAMRRLEVFGTYTGQTFEQFAADTTRAARAVALETGMETGILLEGMNELSKQGLKAREALIGMAAAARIARLEGGSDGLGKSIETTSKLVAAFNFTGDELEFRLNQLGVVANKTRLDYGELGEGMAKLSRGVAAANPHFEDMLFVLAKTRPLSTSIADAGDATRMLYQGVAANAAKVEAILGVRIGRDATGHFTNLSTAIFEARAKGPAAMTHIFEELTRVLGKKSVSALGALRIAADHAFESAGGNAEKARKIFFELKNEMANAGDVIRENVADVMRDNLTPSWDRFVVSIKQVSERLGPALTDPLISLLRSMTEAALAAGRLADLFASATLSFKEGAPWIYGVVVGLSKFLTVGVLVTGTIRTMSFLMASAGAFLTQGFRERTAALLGLEATQAASLRATHVYTLVTQKNAMAHTVLSNALQREALAQAELTFATTQATKAKAADAVASAQQARAAAAATAAGLVGMSRLAVASRVVVGGLTGWFGILLTFATMLVPLFMDFSSDMESLETKATQAGAANRAGMKSFGDANELAASGFILAAENLKKTFGEKPTVLKDTVFAKMPRIMDEMRRNLKPDAQKRFMPGIQSNVAEATRLWGEIQNIYKTTPPDKIPLVSEQLRTQLIQQLEPLGFMTEIIGTQSKFSEQLAGEIKTMGGSLATQGPTQERQAALLQEIANNTAIAINKTPVTIGGGTASAAPAAKTVGGALFGGTGRQQSLEAAAPEAPSAFRASELGAVGMWIGEAIAGAVESARLKMDVEATQRGIETLRERGAASPVMEQRARDRTNELLLQLNRQIAGGITTNVTPESQGHVNAAATNVTNEREGRP